MNDEVETIGRIYEAVGDVERWDRLIERLSDASVTPEIQHHLEVARRVHERETMLAQQVAALSGVYDQLSVGVLVVDHEGTIVRTNASAARLLDAGNGLTREGDRVSACSHDERESLAAAIAKPIPGGSTGAFPFVMLPRPGRSPISVFILRATAAAPPVFDDRQLVVLLIVDPGLDATASTRTLRQLFGFTPREAECAVLLMRGHSVGEAARALGVTRNTARTFLAHITAKTGSRSQADLVRQLLDVPSVS